MRKIFVLSGIFLFSIAFSSHVLAHGEDKYGPNGGFIQMPGAFHTEVLIKDKELRIYLLDLEWKNPLTKNSKLTAGYTVDDQDLRMKCKPIRDYFRCPLPSVFNPRRGELLIEAKRDSVPSAIARYKLPLELKKVD